MEKSEEQSRQRYLTPDEQVPSMPVLSDDLEFLVAPLEIALNAGLRKEELLSIKREYLNFTGLPMFYNGREVNPGWMIIPESKNGRPHQLPMNSIVKRVLTDACTGAKADELIFTFERNGVSWSTIRSGWERACERAKILHGQTVTWILDKE